MCKFVKAWIGTCKKENVTGTDFCEEHSKGVCVSCGAPATKDCEATMGLVCGALLCDNCEHKIDESGCGAMNFGKNGHCKKDEQEYYSWLEKEEMTEAGRQLKERGITLVAGDKHVVNLFKNCDHAPELKGDYTVEVNKKGLLSLIGKVGKRKRVAVK
jgi:hypothetical protein